MKHPSGDPRHLEPVTLSIPNAARYLDVPPETLRTWLKRGVFRKVKIEGRVFLLKRDLDACIALRLKRCK